MHESRVAVVPAATPKFEPAARRWLVRYLSEGTPSLHDVAKVTASLAGLKPLDH